MIFFSLSYILFLRYEPKVVKSLQEVKGSEVALTADDSVIPFPADAQKLSSMRAGRWQQNTFETSKNPQQLQAFYKTVFWDKGWSLDSEGEKDGFLVYRYKKDRQVAHVISSTQDGKTLASIEFTF